jgi:predicted enzyme related to lactoylglutathione lyase
MPGNVSFLEIGSKDAAVSRAFFERVFGWSFNSMGDAGGWFQTPSIKAGLHGSDPQPQLYVFFDVDDLDAAIALVKASGGQADPPGPEEPGFGRFSNCHDPQGIRFGLHQKSHTESVP